MTAGTAVMSVGAFQAAQRVGIASIYLRGSSYQEGRGFYIDPSNINNACEAVLDQVDLMLCGGALKARYGSTPGQPRAIILDAAVSVRSGSNNTNNATTQATSMRERIEDIVWLVATSPEFLVQK